jgi:nicotinamidase-related amidase
LACIDSPATLPDWPMPWPEFAVDWQRAGLLLVDLQNYGCNPAMGVARMLAERYPAIAAYYLPRLTEVVVPAARRLLDGFRAAGRPVLFTRHGPLLPDGSDLIARRRRRDRDAVTLTGRPTLWHRGTPEHAVIEALAPRPGELVIDKNSSGAFNSSGIDACLRNLGLETLVVGGMATEMCVETTARDAADRGWNVILVEDACLTFRPEDHRASLSAMARVFAQVWPSGRVLAELGAAPAAISQDCDAQ